jgi:phage terminase large subunit GpA-like protein
LSPSDWAELNIRIPAGNAIPGLIRFDNAPHQREPLDMMANPDCHRITLMWGAQTGKTQVVNCGIGFNIAQQPASQIVMQPSQGDLQTWLETKLTPLIESNPTLSSRVAKPRGREGVNNQRMKSYPGGFLMFSWSGSPKTMRGRSAPKIYCDETDGYEVTAEGHPVNLLWQRAATFGDQRMLVDTSTPTLKGSSTIEASFEAGDQRRRYVPCPHCEHFQTLKWKNIQWQKDAEGNPDPETTVYVCENCGCEISEGQKNYMLRRGEWRGAKKFTGHASYHLNELYSTFRRWRDVVISFLEKKADNDLQTFVNVSLAETWEEEADTLDGIGLLSRRESYEDVPDGGILLTAGVDCQANYLCVEVVAWGDNEESWNIDFYTLEGDTSKAEVWQDLDDALSKTYTHEGGTEMHIAATGIDSGFRTQLVYDYVRTRSGRRLYALKGVAGAGRPVAQVTRGKKGKKQRPVDLYTVGVDDAKGIVYARLRATDPGPGYCHFPETRQEEYFEQLTGEKVVTRFVKGFPRREWVKTRARNEALDTRVYAYATLKILNPVWPAIKKRLNPVKVKEAPAPKPAPTTRRMTRPTRKRGNFVTSW